MKAACLYAIKMMEKKNEQFLGTAFWGGTIKERKICIPRMRVTRGRTNDSTSFISRKKQTRHLFLAIQPKKALSRKVNQSIKSKLEDSKRSIKENWQGLTPSMMRRKVKKRKIRRERATAVVNTGSPVSGFFTCSNFSFIVLTSSEPTL